MPETTDNRTLENIIPGINRLRAGQGPTAVLELSTRAVKLVVCFSSSIDPLRFDFGRFQNFSELIDVSARHHDVPIDLGFFRARVVPIIRDMLAIARKRGVAFLCAVATAAYRNSADRDAIVSSAMDSAGLSLRILSSEEESRASFDGCVLGLFKDEAPAAKDIIMIDQGGGSTEMVFASGGAPVSRGLLEIGTIALKNALTSPEVSGLSLGQALMECDSLADTAVDGFSLPFKPGREAILIGLGGALTRATGKMANRDQHGMRMTRGELSHAVVRAEKLLAGRFAKAGELVKAGALGTRQLESALIIRLGLPMFIKFMARHGFSQITVSGTGLRYGVLFQRLSIAARARQN